MHLKCVSSKEFEDKVHNLGLIDFSCFFPKVSQCGKMLCAIMPFINKGYNSTCRFSFNFKKNQIYYKVPVYHIWSKR